MNPLTNVRNITKLSEHELNYNDGKTSWHDEYKSSAWIFIGGLPYELTEGDVIAVFSQYGEPVNLNLIRDKDSGKSKGFGFLCYEDQRSTVLAVDNFNGIKIAGRTIRVDHVKDYKPPKDSDKLDDITRSLHMQGCGPGTKLPGVHTEETRQHSEEENDIYGETEILRGLKELKSEPGSSPLQSKKRRKDAEKPKKSKKSKKEKKSKSKKSKKSKKRKHKSSSSEDDSSSSSSSSGGGEDSQSDNKKRRRKS